MIRRITNILRIYYWLEKRKISFCLYYEPNTMNIFKILSVLTNLGGCWIFCLGSNNQTVGSMVLKNLSCHEAHFFLAHYVCLWKFFVEKKNIIYKLWTRNGFSPVYILVLFVCIILLGSCCITNNSPFLLYYFRIRKMPHS